MFKGLKPILYGGREVWPLVEGGKGVSATNHASSGAWATIRATSAVTRFTPELPPSVEMTAMRSTLASGAAIFSTTLGIAVIILSRTAA